MKWMYIFGLFLLLFVSFVTTTHAQTLGSTNASIATDPQYPEPNTRVALTLNAYTYDQLGSSIAWYINGVEDVTKRNKRDIEITVGDYSDTTEIIARLTLADGRVIDTKRTITPTRVDIVLESDTTVPLFYKGRALPSPGSTIRAVAIPVSRHTPSELTYTWKLNNNAIHKGPLRGQNTAEFTLPYGGDAMVSVEVADTNGVAFAKKNVQIVAVEPEMHFYETNALRGLSRNALSSPYQLIADEITVRAEPYFMTKNIFEGEVHTEWEINGGSVSNPSLDPQNLTLRKSGGRGSFRVEFHIRNLENLLQGVREDFIISF